MNKKIETKKLQLSKQTVKTLASEDLVKVVGGMRNLTPWCSSAVLSNCI